MIKPRKNWEAETARTLPRRPSRKHGFGKFLDVSQKRQLLEWSSKEVDRRSLAIGPVTPSAQTLAEILGNHPFASADDAWEFLWKFRDSYRRRL